MEPRDREIVRLGARADFLVAVWQEGRMANPSPIPRGTLLIQQLRDVTVRLARPRKWPTWDRLMNEPH